MTKRRFLIVAVITVVAFLGAGAFSCFWQCTLSDKLIRAELYILMRAVERYSHDNGFIYPADWSIFDDEQLLFADTQEIIDMRRRLKVSSLADRSSVEYVWIGDKRYTPDHLWKTPEQVEAQFDALEKLYGEFDYYRSHYGTDIRQGMPTNEIIVLLYDTDLHGKRTYVVLLNFGIELLPRKKADEMVVLQNAYLRLPVNESDVGILIKGLLHPNSGFRFRSAEALAKLDRPEGREFLNLKFESDDIYLKVRAADALARLGERTAIDFLQATAEESSDKYIRVFAEITLREIGEWQPTEMQYFTDEEWEKEKDWGATPLPCLPEDIDKAYPMD